MSLPDDGTAVELVVRPERGCYDDIVAASSTEVDSRLLGGKAEDAKHLKLD